MFSIPRNVFQIVSKQTKQNERWLWWLQMSAIEKGPMFEIVFWKGDVIMDVVIHLNEHKYVVVVGKELWIGRLRIKGSA